MIDKSCCSWAQYCSRVVKNLFFVCATELNPPTRSHRGLFDLQVTHVGYGETWKEKDVVEAYSMKRSHPNYALPGAMLKSFTCLDNNKILSTDLSNENFGCRHTLRSAKISDGWRNIQTPICTSRQMFASDRVVTSDIATEDCSSLEYGWCESCQLQMDLVNLDWWPSLSTWTWSGIERQSSESWQSRTGGDFRENYTFQTQKI